MNENFNETVFNCITSVNALMTSNEVAKDSRKWFVISPTEKKYEKD